MNKNLLITILLTLICSISSLNAQLILYEGFDYSLPGNIGGDGNAGSTSNNWTTHSVTSGQTTTIDLMSGSLNYIGLPAPTGNKVYFFSNANTVSRDVNRAFTFTDNNYLYYSAFIKIIDNSQITATGDYFMHFGQTSGTSVTTFTGRLGVKSVNSGANFRFIIQNTAGGTPTFTEFPQDFTFGNTYFVVVKYDRNTSPGTAYLWVNPAPGTTEPGGSVTNNSGTNTTTGFASICLRNSSTTPKAEIDEIRVGYTYSDVAPVDNTPPQATFNPASNEINVPVNVKPTITFDEPVRKTDGSELTNTDLASLVSFKKNDASGEDVPFTAVIDASKKVITVTPSAVLSNGQVYYLAIGPVEDYAGNEATLKSITFTTVLTAIPTITVTWPNGGEVMYSGDIKTVTWTTTDFTPTEMIKIEVYALDQGSGTWSWITIVPSTDNDGACDVTVGPDAPYGTNYLIRVSGVTNGVYDVSDAPFTIIATATTMKQLRSNPQGSKVRYDGEAVITFIRTANRNQKYLQDATAGILIDDASGVLTTTLAEGDKITSLEGQIGLYGGLLQIVPVKSTVNVISNGNSVTPVVMTIGEYLANRADYESMLIKLTNVYFPDGDGTKTFSESSNYYLTDGTSTVQFRTYKASESNIVGSVIPVQHLDLTGIGGVFNTTAQVYSRTLADFSVITAIGKTGENDIRIYPVPFGESLNIENSGLLTGIEIRDITGRVVITVNNNGAGIIRIETTKLPSGIYFLKLISPQETVIRKIVKK